MLETFNPDNEMLLASIQELTTLVETNSSKIPNPTTADAGKVLSVNESGKYELAEGGGGGSREPYINITEFDPDTLGIVYTIMSRLPQPLDYSVDTSAGVSTYYLMPGEIEIYTPPRESNESLNLYDGTFTDPVPCLQVGRIGGFGICLYGGNYYVTGNK